MNRKLLISGLAAMSLMGFAACGGGDDDEDCSINPEITCQGKCGPVTDGCGVVQDCGACDTDAGTTDAGTTDAGTTDAGTTDAGTTDAGTTDAGTTDAGTSDAGTTDAGTTDAGTSDAGTTDAGTTDAGIPDNLRDGFEACGASVSDGDVLAWDGKSLNAGGAYHYDYKDGTWEIEYFSTTDESATTYVWVDVNNGEDDGVSLAPGNFELGAAYYYEEGGYLMCWDRAYYDYEADETSPAACAGIAVGSEFYEMVGGDLSITSMSTTDFGGSVSNGNFAPWSEFDYDDDGNETGCYLPPISFSFSGSVTEGTVYSD